MMNLRLVGALAKRGAKGNNSTAVEDGTCVKTMVLIRPMRRASGPANTAPMPPRK